MERRLAAIVAADIVGYSRLMGEDEPGTLSAIGTLRSDVIDPAIATSDRRLEKPTGDGILYTVSDTVEAVNYALEVQDRVSQMTCEAKAAQSIELRIGVNVGDIMVEDGDVFGDGVNVAARLEGLSDPGGVLLSRSAYDQVRY